ncbi:MAG TPA: Ig-like domain-containing protein, partial [Anaerolineales bacterium]
TFYNNNAGSASTLKVDWVYVRLYREPEPAASVGAEQGLVELGISMVDYPDPLRTGEELNYVLTIENNSVIDAPNVIVTDTLPETVQLVGKDPDCYEHPSGVVVCNFSLIPSNSTINTTIVVSPYTNGLITNTVEVSSPGYEFVTGNNSADEVTLVDSAPPIVNWVKPVTNGGNYAISGGEVSLEASAYDDDQVARVEFVLWDHISENWVTVGSDSTPPYQVPFDMNTLECQQIYQMYVIGVDRAGNRSNPYNPLKVIYLERSTCSVFLPLTVK